MDNINNVTL